MAKIHYNQGHLEVIKIYEKLLQENIASSKQLASENIEIAKKSAAESIASYISIWEGYYKEYHPEQWQTKLEEEKQKIESELQDQICKINTELEEQIKQAGEAHKKAIEEQEKVHESLLDIEINSQISLAGGQKTFFVKKDPIKFTPIFFSCF
jgi:CRISPR/Cas system CMR subunit Cmr6 (Cas7 group RAMP superfamily)